MELVGNENYVQTVDRVYLKMLMVTCNVIMLGVKESIYTILTYCGITYIDVQVVLNLPR